MADYIKKANRKTNFTTVNNDFLHDVNLSWKAKGMIVYIMSLPPDWDLNVSDLKNRSKDGRDATAAGLRELIDSNYCRRVRSREKGGIFAGYDYEVSDVKFEPQPENPFMGSPQPEMPETENPETVNPSTENPKQVNTNTNNETLLVNTNSSDTPHDGASLFPDLDQQKIEEQKRLEAEKLADEEAKKRTTLFRNSDVFKMVNFDIVPADYSVFEKCFSGDEYTKIDLVYYFHSVSDWSDQKNMKRTKMGWLATIRNFIRGDIEKNKLKLKPEFKPETQKTNVAGAMDYLNEYD